MKRNGRPPKEATGEKSTLTIKIPADLKNRIVELADGYDMTITEYITTLVKRDATTT
jgi:antitoxin component of RelBE/YafQ-DinJ toxin-antitoxin module